METYSDYLKNKPKVEIIKETFQASTPQEEYIEYVEIPKNGCIINLAWIVGVGVACYALIQYVM